MQEKTTHDFSTALDYAKRWKKVARLAFRDTCYIRVQFPDEWSLNTKPYLQMIKWNDIFPVDLSCESIFADDWYIIE